MEFTLTNPEGTQTWTPTKAQWETTPDGVLAQLEGLQVGGRYADEDGFTWERIA